MLRSVSVDDLVPRAQQWQTQVRIVGLHEQQMTFENVAIALDQAQEELDLMSGKQRREDPWRSGRSRICEGLH